MSLIIATILLALLSSLLLTGMLASNIIAGDKQKENKYLEKQEQIKQVQNKINSIEKLLKEPLEQYEKDPKTIKKIPTKVNPKICGLLNLQLKGLYVGSLKHYCFVT